MYSFLEFTMAFGQAVAPTVQISRRALTGSLPVLLLLAMAAAMMLATGPSTGQFHIPNLEKQSEQRTAKTSPSFYSSDLALNCLQLHQ